MNMFQNFCCCILGLYISSISQHKKFAWNSLLSIFIIFFHMDEMVRIGVIMGYFDARI